MVAHSATGLASASVQERAGAAGSEVVGGGTAAPDAETVLGGVAVADGEAVAIGSASGGRQAGTLAITTMPSLPIRRRTPLSISARSLPRVDSSWLAVRLISETRACSSRCIT